MEDIPIFLGATAGMRVLHPDDATLIMNNIRKEFRDQPYMF